MEGTLWTLGIIDRWGEIIMVEPKELFGNDYQEFCIVDPFNPKNEVSGYISRKPNEYYGALLIEKVNNKKVRQQLVMGSPKMHYPFFSREDGSRNYRFPTAQKIEIYDKLDGTNVVSYFYYDDKDRYVTYKPRLRPFLQPGRYGDFLGMWKEVAHDFFKEINQGMNQHQCNLSFELYGSRNPHLIIYENNLDIALLFGVTNEGKIISPAQLKLVNLPVVNMVKVVDKDYVWNYESLQKDLEGRLKAVDEEHYSGDEGMVWYLYAIDGRCIQLKLKPETIEAIHFAIGAGLGKNSIITTCWNAFETTDTPTVDLIKQMLLEEFTQEKIDPQSELIERCLVSVMEEAEFRAKVLDEYRATGANILTDKAGVMRKLSSKFAKNEIRRVYDIIKGYA